MKYLILIHSNPRSASLGELLRRSSSEGYAYYAALNDEPRRLGRDDRVRGACRSVGPAPPRTRPVVSSDGPFAEVKEHLAGFFLVQCESMDRAVEIAARVPESAASPCGGAPGPEPERTGDVTVARD